MFDIVRLTQSVRNVNCAETVFSSNSKSVYCDSFLRCQPYVDYGNWDG